MRKKFKPRLVRGKLKSGLEERTLKYLKRHSTEVKYETLTLPYTLRKNYVADFVCLTKSGKTVIIETKGWFRADDRTKMRAVKKDNPHIDIRLVFDKDNKLGKGSTMTYSQWSDKYGFPYSIGNPPKEWFV